MKVATGFAGSTVIVWINDDFYIDAGPIRVGSDSQLIEVVRGGQVIARQHVWEKAAPAVIVTVMRNIKRSRYDGLFVEH